MDYQRKQQRIGILTVILCLLIVVLWRMYSPTLLQAYRYRQDEAQLKQELRAIHLPPETEKLNVEVIHVEGHTFLMSGYHAHSDFESIKAYYKKEFAQRGFTYHDRGKDKLRFCNAEYRATITGLTIHDSEQIYFIALYGKDAQC